MLDEKVNVLLIDDDECQHILVRDLLKEARSASFVVEWVSNCGLALEALVLGKHDVCLLDYRMGEDSGLVLMREAITRGAKTPVIVLAGIGNHEADMAAMKAGAVDYLCEDDLNAPAIERAIRYAVQRRSFEEERALKERLHGVLEMAGAACHEMNQPLQVITGYVDYLLSGLALAPTERDEILKIVQEQTRRMGQITAKLKNIAKYETREYNGRSRIVDIDKASSRNAEGR